VRRLLAGVHYENRDFSTLAGHEDSSLPEDRVLAYPWVGVEWIEDEYVQAWNLDQIGRTEDLYLGKSARFEAGFAGSAFGSTHDALILDGEFRTGAQLTEDQYLVSTIDYAGRLEQGSLHDGRIDLTSRYYLRHSPRRVFFAAATASLTEKLDRDEQLLLGGDNGLRGYPLRYQGGTVSALVTLEERFYTSWQPLKLFNVGAAVFFDVGRTWGRDAYAGESLGWLKDAGFGLRLGSARSGLGNVLHVDLAFPLDGGSEIDSMQFIIETRRSF
jgi:hemolysin activation/secretion protein